MDSNNNFTGGEQPQYNNQYPQQDMSQNYQYSQQNMSQNYQYPQQDMSQNYQYSQQYMNQNSQYQQNMQVNQYQQNTYQNMVPNRPAEISQNVKYNQYGMRWFLFMAWGYLIYSVINNISSAFQMFKLADAYSNYNYNDLNDLCPLLVIEGLFLLALAVFSFYARKLLMNFSVKAPNAVTACIAGPLVAIIIFILGAVSISELEFDEVMSLIGSLLSSSDSWVVWIYLILYGILIYGNIVYFKKRKNIFNNTQQIKLF